MRTLDALTILVLEYKQTGSEKHFQDIIELSEGLIYMVMKYYCMEYFPKLIQEEVIEESRSIILLKAITNYKEDYGAKFSTYYVWKLKSFIRCKQQYFLNRKKLLAATSLNKSIAGGDGDSSIALEDLVTKFDMRIKHKAQKKVNEIFGI